MEQKLLENLSHLIKPTGNLKTVITDQNTEQAATLYTIKLRSDVEIWQLFDRKQEASMLAGLVHNGRMIRIYPR